MLLAIAIAAAGESEVWLTNVPGPRYASASAAAVGGLALAWRRRSPLTISMLVLAVECGQFWLGVPQNAPTTPVVVLVVAMYTLGDCAPTRHAVLGGAFALGVIWSVVLVHASPVDPSGIPYTAAIVLAPLVLGRALRSTKHQAEHTVRQAALDHERATREAIVDERARIARELHDVVSHSISAMGIQAGAVRRLLPRGSELETALRSVEDTGRDALEEMHRLLLIVRAGDGDHAAALGPQPCLARVSELIGQARGAGLTVDLHIEGDRVLSPGLDLAAYRIIQEALTNVRRHAAAARARVDVYHRERELEIVVTDDGPALSGPIQAGHGIIGMRERVSLYGGELDVGPGAERGCIVRARLPIAERA